MAAWSQSPSTSRMGTSMFGWVFKKRGNEPGSTPALATPNPPPVAGKSVPDVDWTAALAQARGDDDALLALARTAAAPLQFKQAAVEALDGEAALKLASANFAVMTAVSTDSPNNACWQRRRSARPASGPCACSRPREVWLEWRKCR